MKKEYVVKIVIFDEYGNEVAAEYVVVNARGKFSAGVAGAKKLSRRFENQRDGAFFDSISGAK